LEAPAQAQPETPVMPARYVRLGLQRQALHIGFGSIQTIIHNPEVSRRLIELAWYYLSPRTRSQATDYLVSTCNADQEDTDIALDILQRSPYLTPPESYDPEDRYSRHALYFGLSGDDPARVQRDLANRHVLLIGCGGLGGLISATLATAGLGRITLVDDDHVELSNLTRQWLFAESDVGRPKSEVLRQQLVSRNADVEVCVVGTAVETFADLDALPSADLVVLSADSPGIVDLTNQHCIDRAVPWIHVCYVNDVAAWGPLVLPGVTGCWQCGDLIARERSGAEDLTTMIRAVNSRYQAPSFGPINALAAGFVGLDILRHLGDFGVPASLNQRIGLWTHQLRFEYQDCSLNPACTVCGSRRDLVDHA
jgi:molybdopterin-synthase adenylyltransferase